MEFFLFLTVDTTPEFYGNCIISKKAGHLQV